MAGNNLRMPLEAKEYDSRYKDKLYIRKLTCYMHGCHWPVLEGRPCGVSRCFHWAASFIARVCSRRYHLQRMHGTIAMLLLCADVSLQLPFILH